MIEWLKRILGIADLEPASLIGVGLFLFVARAQLCCDRDRDGKDPGELFQLALQPGFFAGSHWLVRWGAVIAKNIFGVFLILAGHAVSLPGVRGREF